MIQTVAYSEASPVIRAVRTQVFQVEQHIDPAVEVDGLDETAFHLLAIQDSKVIGTTRVRVLSDRIAKIERVAVLPDYRKRGFGKKLMETAIALVRDRQIPEVKLNAQVHARSFYEKLGFQQWSEEFQEAGILHIEMRRYV
ncbi:GNAT family N-acetyltransferase [Microcoleus sp. FACHB-1515]|uniref:GNAT family N-acetyltransferase n=1 Tax=Cyanophyceae TaxID=3028117 RepID=UPI0018EFD86B|nr:GNAT family N-acetyltransferase [Microcoleus sp. FACHB-1515]